jgi:DNA-binding CsgD family transcriptional regulator
MGMLAETGNPGGGFLADAEGGLGSSLAFLVDELAHGVIVATTEGRMLHSNQAARHELIRQRVLFATDDQLQTCTADNARILQEALAKVTGGKRSLIELAIQDGPGLTLAVMPLRSGVDRGPRAALLFARATVCDSLMLCFFARSHGLTAAEEHVLSILCQGFSAPQIAGRLKVAVSTVRSHVRSMCAKTRSSGVRELVNRVAMLPPVAPPFWREPMH